MAFAAVGIFIIACAFTHFMGVWTLWQPLYWLSGDVKLITAVASVITAVALPPLVPKTLALIQTAKVSEERKQRLEAAHQELELLYAKTKELDELKTQFFANVSHELRTPLALMLGPTEKLLAGGGLTEEQRHDLSVVDRNARLLLKHVNELLDLSRLEAGRMDVRYAEVDLADLVRLTASHFETLSAERRIDFSVETPATVPAQLDAEKVGRVLFNLLSNAFKFTPDGGRIRCVLEASGERAILSVQDNGPGVPPALREAIFERFRQAEAGPTRRFGGTGLGLAIAKEFVELQGGTIGVSDAPGGGACFRVELPLRAPTGAVGSETAVESAMIQDLAKQALADLRPIADDGRATAREEGPSDRLDPELENQPANRPANLPDDQPANQPDDRPDRREALVLVVEDNPDMNRFIRQTLARDHRIASASDGWEGIEKALALHPDLIVTDLMMPRLSGDQVVRQVRAHPDLATVPTVLLTAKADDELRVELLRAGAQDYLIKPFSAEELRARVGNLVRLKRAQDVLQRELASQSQDVAVLAGELTARSRDLKAAVVARDEFLSVAAHELKTPVTSLRAAAQLLIRQLDRAGAVDRARLRRMLEIVDQQSDKLSRLVTQLLDVSRVDTGQLAVQPEVTDIVRLVKDAVRGAQATTSRHTLVVDAPDQALALVDPLRFEQVITNLVDNAIKYSPDGGRIEIEVARPTPETLRLAVRDYGTGIPPDQREGLFDRFYQAHAESHGSGLGLGLYLSRQIVELHGGRIGAEFPPDGGTRFVVTLPTNLPGETTRPEGS